MSTLKGGVIGCGTISKVRHLPEYQNNIKVEIVAVCDIVAERAEAMLKLILCSWFSENAHNDNFLKLFHLPLAVGICPNMRNWRLIWKRRRPVWRNGHLRTYP